MPPIVSPGPTLYLEGPTYGIYEGVCFVHGLRSRNLGNVDPSRGGLSVTAKYGLDGTGFNGKHTWSKSIARKIFPSVVRPTLKSGMHSVQAILIHICGMLFLSPSLLLSNFLPRSMGGLIGGTQAIVRLYASVHTPCVPWSLIISPGMRLGGLVRYGSCKYVWVGAKVALTYHQRAAFAYVPFRPESVVECCGVFVRLVILHTCA